MKYLCCLVISLSSLIIAYSTDAFSDDQDEVAAALTRFLRAFENGELEVMEAAFASDATSFPRARVSYEAAPDLRAADYHRIRGPPNAALVVGFRASDAEPPYMELEPKDLEIVVFTDAALATFHLEGNNRVSDERSCWRSARACGRSSICTPRTWRASRSDWDWTLAQRGSLARSPGTERGRVQRPRGTPHPHAA